MQGEQRLLHQSVIFFVVVVIYVTRTLKRVVSHFVHTHLHIK